MNVLIGIIMPITTVNYLPLDYKRKVPCCQVAFALF
jgi:hypothetical protein